MSGVSINLIALARMLSEHIGEFYDALSRDFKTGLVRKKSLKSLQNAGNNRGHEKPS